MSAGFGVNSKPKANSDAYRSSSYWQRIEERKQAEEDLKKMGLMSETSEEFIARGGEVTKVPEGEMAFQRISDHKRHVERKKMESK
jgi:hypothetical protein